MNTNMNMNGRRKRRSIDSKQEELEKMKRVFENSTLIATEFDLNFENNDESEEILENLHDSFHQCRTKIQNMDLNCEENIILTSWDMMRKMKDSNNFCTMPLPPPHPELISNPTDSFIYNFINLKHKKYLLKNNKC